ncbi:MAG: helix-turn-helix transcriptional regulator [Clostridia bacterium]|nr:helix-turn-helix transcriptional regulator [Clostridia bacterium]
MNDIVYAGAADGFCGNKNKYLKILVPERGGIITVIPPYFNDEKEYGGGLLVLIEQPMIALKNTAGLEDVYGGGIAHAARQAAEFDSAPVLSALGGLLVSYINFALGTQKKSPVVENLIDELQKNVGDALFSVEDCIRKLPLNYDYVRKLFKKETGLTPREYLTHLRMQRAQALITSGISNRYSNYTVSQIAEACGFSEPLYFSRVFKKHFGVSPTLYK